MNKKIRKDIIQEDYLNHQVSICEYCKVIHNNFLLRLSEGRRGGGEGGEKGDIMIIKAHM